MYLGYILKNAKNVTKIFKVSKLVKCVWANAKKAASAENKTKF